MTTKCDGNHGGPRCGDPECWNDDPGELEYSSWFPVPEREPRESELVCWEAYAALGVYLVGLAEAGHPQAEKMLDNLAQASLVHDDVLPFEDAEPPVEIDVERMNRALRGPRILIPQGLSAQEVIDFINAHAEAMQDGLVGWQWRRAVDPWPETILSFEPAVTVAGTEKRSLYAGPVIGYAAAGERDAAAGEGGKDGS